MAILGKKSETTTIPELQDYYATKKKDNTGLAWLLAFASLLVTVAILVALFMGGRWLYRTITGDDKKEQVTTTEQKPTTETATTTPSTGTTTPATGSSVTGGSSDSTTTALINGTPPPKPQGVSPSQTPEQNSSAVAATTNIPNTGASETFALFAVTVVLGSLYYRKKLLQKK